MGGLGSGNHYHWWRGTKKTTVESCRALDSRRFAREGILTAGVRHSGNWVWTYLDQRTFSVQYEVDTTDGSNLWLHLLYSWIWTATQQTDSADYWVRLTTTRPPFGGLRWWFICPLVINGRACGRRIGKLYLPPSGRYFGCRKCHDLTYRSCQESRKGDGVYRWLAKETGYDVETVKQAMRSMGKRRE